MNKNILYLIISLVGIIALVIVLKFILPNANETETETVYCGPNKSLPVKVFKNPTKAFPAFSKDYDLQLNGSIELIDSIQKIATVKGTGGMGFGSKTVELREKLNQESARMEMLMKSNFFAYNANPCDSAVKTKYFSLLEVMTNKIMDLERFKAEVTVSVNKGSTKEKQIEVVKDTVKLGEAINKILSEYKFER